MISFIVLKVKNKIGSEILSAVVATAILSIVAVGVGGAFFGIGQMKARTQAKATVMDYEKAFVQALGQQAMTQLATCDNAFPKNVNLVLGDLGSASLLAGNLRAQLNSSLGVSRPTTEPLQSELNNAFNSCNEEPTVPVTTDPGSYIFCVGFQGKNGVAFQGMMGVFAQVRLDLQIRSRNSNFRVLNSAATCEAFRTIYAPEFREIKISYKLFFKKMDGEMGIFTKAGSALYSN